MSKLRLIGFARGQLMSDRANLPDAKVPALKPCVVHLQN